MKIIFFVFIVQLSLSAQAVPELVEAGKKNAQLQAELWTKNLDESRQMNKQNKFEFLALGLRNMGHQMNYEQNRVFVNDIYKAIQQEFYKDDNYINFFTQKIETERAKVAEHSYHSGTRNSFNDLRVDIIRDTLCHLPSPATVRVLGHYLSDERDTPPPRYRGQDWIDCESNAYQACTALEKIGLRNAPVPPRSVQSESNLATWRLWWAQVEAGTRSFSFEGEDVEYRFRKDGTWEQSPLSKTTKQVRENTTPATAVSVWSSAKVRWSSVIAAILLGTIWLQWKKRRNQTV
jgi:hypothetical protein